MKSLNNNPLCHYLKKAGLIRLSDTEIYQHCNVPIQNLKVNLLMLKKKLKTQLILRKYLEHPEIKTVSMWQSLCCCTCVWWIIYKKEEHLQLNCFFLQPARRNIATLYERLFTVRNTIRNFVGIQKFPKY